MPKHISVLLNESIDLLDLKDGGTYVDLTLGRAGHSGEILKRIPHGHLVAFDQDEQALIESREVLASIGDSFTLIKDNFANVKSRLEELHIDKVDGILADLGVSSPQLDEANRGFSYNALGPLDMRMDKDNPITAEKVLNTYSLHDLTRVIELYGEEKDAYKIAKSIVRQREIAPLKTTFDLVEAIKRAKTMKELAKKGHPAKQTFQAIRMEVNAEKATLQAMLQDAPLLLKEGGRMAIITFMSLDDRLVKNRFNELTKIEGTRHGPESLKIDNQEAEFVSLTRKPITPSEEEIGYNHRAVSAKLRGIARR